MSLVLLENYWMRYIYSVHTYILSELSLPNQLFSHGKLNKKGLFCLKGNWVQSQAHMPVWSPCISHRCFQKTGQSS